MSWLCLLLAILVWAELVTGAGNIYSLLSHQPTSLSPIHRREREGKAGSRPLLPPLDLIAMSAALEKVKDYLRNINPSRSFDETSQYVRSSFEKATTLLQNKPMAASSSSKRGSSSDDKKKRVLILMSDTGGGHRASAQALDRSLSEQFPGKINVTIMDIWTEHANYPFNNFVPMYRYLAKNPLLWRGFYAYGQFAPTKLFTEVWSWQNSYKSFKDAIIGSNPDLVVSVHPLCQLMPIWAVEEMNKVRDRKKLPINFITVVTDLGGAHSTWFDRRADKIFIPSNAVKKLARAQGFIAEDKIVMRGLPIRPAFWKNAQPKAQLRKMLGLTQKAKTVLLMGGGDGVGGLPQIAIEIAKSLGKASSMQSQVIVICGHNAAVKHKLQTRKYPDNVRVVVKGFIDNVDEFMGASDCLVTKAGPGTIAEAMTRGLPLILSSFLPGQVSERRPPSFLSFSFSFSLFLFSPPHLIPPIPCTPPRPKIVSYCRRLAMCPMWWTADLGSTRATGHERLPRRCTSSSPTTPSCRRCRGPP